MSLAEQFQEIEAQLPEDWNEARLRLTARDERNGERAAQLLAPAGAGRHGRVITFDTARRVGAPVPGLVRRLLRGLDLERIDGELEVVSMTKSERPAETPQSFAADWEEQVAGLPPDWSDLYCEVELDSSDYLERAALLMAPLNPARVGAERGFRFRCARRFGYGAAPDMVRRCLERLDDEGIRGRVRILQALSDTKPYYTQGPVWHVGGKTA
ncbi:MAG: hypothetical protein WBB74_01470 [Gaiellaceae bacterium]